jgi:hypothetical protein
MNPNNESHRERFFKAVEHHYKALDHFRQGRAKLIEQYAGTMYRSIAGERKYRIFVNLMQQTAQAYMLALAGSRPRYLITAGHRLAKFSKHFQVHLNNLIEEIRLEESLSACAMDAFFGPAFMKIYLADAPMVEVEADTWMDPGRPFADRVSMDDLVYDTDAQDFRAVQFMLDRYRIPFYVLQEDEGRFDPDVVSQLKPAARRDLAETSELAQGISIGHEADQGEFEPMVDLVDVYFPRENQIVTWATQSRMRLLNTDPLVVHDWDGVETGPYRYLNLGPVPDNVMPSSPAANLKYLFDLANSLYRKMNLQARRQKNVFTAEPGSEEDAGRIRDAEDGAIVTVSHNDAHSQINIPGVDQNVLGFAMHAVTLADRMAGNISTRLGLGAEAETAAQERMIGARVSRQESFMQQKMVKFASEIGKDLAYLLYTDPVKEMAGRVRVDGTKIEYTSNWTPEYRDGQFGDYSLQIEPYSMAYKTPQERAGVLMQMVQQLAPLFPMLQQQGWEFDLGRFLELQSELLSEPRLLEVFKPGGPKPPEQQGGGGQHDATQAPVTTRNNVRTSVTGPPSDAAREQGVMQMMSQAGAANGQS